MVTVAWDTWLRAGKEAEGLRLTRQVWSDMRAFEGYISHQILVNQDAPGHIIAPARWRTREDPDRILTPLLARPRERWFTSDDEPSPA